MVGQSKGEICYAILHYLKAMENNLKRTVEIKSEKLGRFYFPRNP